jgi:hypothetical protein
MLLELDKDYTDPEALEKGEPKSVRVEMTAVDVAGNRHEAEIQITYDAEQVRESQVREDVRKELEKEIRNRKVTDYFGGRLITDKIVSFEAGPPTAWYES